MKLSDQIDLSTEVLNSLSAQVAVLDLKGELLSANAAWKSYLKESGKRWNKVNEGENFLEHCRNYVGKDKPFVNLVYNGISDVIRGGRSEYAVEFPAHQGSKKRWFLMNVRQLREGGEAGGVVITNVDISMQKSVEEELSYQAQFNSMVNSISNQLFEIQPYGAHEAFESILGQIGTFLRADIAVIHYHREEIETTTPICKWVIDDSRAASAKSILDKHSDLSWLVSEDEDLPCLILDLEKDLKEAVDMRKVRALKQVQSWAIVPVPNENVMTGSIQFFWVSQKAPITVDHLERFSILGDLVLNAIFLKRTEFALTQSESKLESLLSNLPDSILELDSEGRIIYSNQMLPGLDATEQIIGLSVFDLFPQERRAEFRKLLKKSSRTGNTATLLIPIPREDVMSWWSARIIPLNSAEDEKHLVISTDITTEIKSNRALKQSERLYRLLAENMQDMVSQHQPDGTFVWVSQSVQQILGYTPEELNGIVYYDLFHPDDAAYMRNYAHHLTLSENYNESLRMEYRVKKKSKRYCWFESLTKPIYNNEGEVVKLQITSRDITKRREAEQALQTSKERQELALRGADLGLWDWNIKTGQYIYDRRWAGMLGYKMGEIGNTLSAWADLVHPDDMNKINEALKLHLQGEQELYEAELRLMGGDGKYKWILSRGKVLEWDEYGKATRAVGTHLDITQNKRIEAMIVNTIVETQEKERIRFAKDLHDGVGQYLSAIRFNLNAIASQLEAVDSDFSTELIDRCNDLLDTTVQDLRGISHNIMPGTLNDFGLIAAVEEMLGMITDSAEIEVDFTADEPHKRYNSNIEIGLYRILQELINNTLKHANATSISIDLEEDDEEQLIRLQYSDDGVGLPKTRKKKQGKGIGLQNMDSRVKSLNGTIRFYEPERGVAVHIAIPLDASEE